MTIKIRAGMTITTHQETLDSLRVDMPGADVIAGECRLLAP